MCIVYIYTHTHIVIHTCIYHMYIMYIYCQHKRYEENEKGEWKLAKRC